MEPTHIGHGTIKQPLDHHLRQDVDLALARLEQRMINYIDTHGYSSERMNAALMLHRLSKLPTLSLRR